MAKADPAGAKKTGQKLEFEPDAWERFERAVKVVAKSPPQHRAKKAIAKKRKKPARTPGA